MSYIASLLILLSPGLNVPRRQPVPTAQRVYCERSYTNFAWGYKHKGIYVDPEGNLYSYSYQPKDKPWSPKQSDAPTAEELEDKYSHGRTLVRKLEPQEWATQQKLLAAASQGEMSKRKQSGADMGTSSCHCYIADADGQHYKQIALRVRGDWSSENLAPAAQTLAEWLDALAGSTEKKPAR